MRTHVTAQEIVDLGTCSDFPLEVMIKGLGPDPITIEDYIATPHEAYGVTNREKGVPQVEDNFWALTGLMSDDERMEYIDWVVNDIKKIIEPQEWAMIADDVAEWRVFKGAGRPASSHAKMEARNLEIWEKNIKNQVDPALMRRHLVHNVARELNRPQDLWRRCRAVTKYACMLSGEYLFHDYLNQVVRILKGE